MNSAAAGRIVQPKSVGLVGVPLVDGQDLEGADLAPLALRKAGLQKMVAKCGFAFQDYGDLDFSARYEELGLDFKRRASSKPAWEKWMASGSPYSFTEWSHQEMGCAEGSQTEGTEAHPQPVDKTLDPYDNVDNAHLMGPAVELIYRRSLEIVKDNQFLLAVGGDHSIATGTIAAVTQKYKDLAVIWIDAHGDCNTPNTSPSLHYHGMPAAHVMGWFDRNPKGFEWMGEQRKFVDESRMAFIGLRDVDPEEGKLIRGSGCHAYTMHDVDKLGVRTVVQRVLESIDPNCNRPLHLSLDIDGIDPGLAPGTGTCARGGLSYREIHYICEELALTRRLVSMDLVEINPGLDGPPPRGNAMHGDDPDLQRTTPTVQLGIELVQSALGKTILSRM